MTILITGATGAVGRHLTGALASAGEQVRAASRKPQEAGLPEGVEVVGTDLAASSTLTANLFDGVDRMFVFPFASLNAEKSLTLRLGRAHRTPRRSTYLCSSRPMYFAGAGRQNPTWPIRFTGFEHVVRPITRFIVHHGWHA
ncbi:SDR family oxidoreductase [Micromonosporaceae bacterium Da 78-11]